MERSEIELFRNNSLSHSVETLLAYLKEQTATKDQVTVYKVYNLGDNGKTSIWEYTFCKDLKLYLNIFKSDFRYSMSEARENFQDTIEPFDSPLEGRFCARFDELTTFKAGDFDGALKHDLSNVFLRTIFTKSSRVVLSNQSVFLSDMGVPYPNDAHGPNDHLLFKDIREADAYIKRIVPSYKPPFRSV